MNSKFSKTALICTLVVISSLIMVFVFKVSPIITLAIILCPLMHVFMMSSGNHKH